MDAAGLPAVLYAELEDRIALGGIDAGIAWLGAQRGSDGAAIEAIDRWVAFTNAAAFAIDRQETADQRRVALRQMAFDDEDPLVSTAVRQAVRSSDAPPLHLIDGLSSRRTSEGVVLEGHARDVRYLVLSDDGLIVSAGRDGAVRTWDPMSGNLVSVIELRSVRGLVPVRGPFVAASGADGSVVVLDVRNGTVAHPLIDARACVTWAMARVGESHLVVGYFDGLLTSVDLRSRVTTSSQHHASVIRTLHAVGGRVIVGGYDGLVSVCDERAQPLQILPSHGHPLRAISSHGDLFCTGDDGGKVYSWRLGTDAPMCEVPGPRRGVHHLLLLSEERLIVADFDGGLRLLDPRSGAIVARVRGHTARIRTLVRRTDGTILTASDDRTIRIWRSGDLEETGRFTGHLGWVRAVCELRDRRLVSASLDKTVRVWPPDPPAARKADHRGWVRALAACGTARVASASEDGSVKLWSVDDGSCLDTVHWSSTVVRCIASSDPLVVAGADDGSVARWHRSGNRLLDEEVVSGAHDKVRAIAALGPELAVTAGADGRLRAWDAHRWVPRVEHVVAPGVSWRTLCCVDPTTVVAGAEDGHLVVWNVDEDSVYRLSGHEGRIWATTMVGPSTLLSVSFDRTARLWDLEARREIGCVAGPLGASWDVVGMDGSRFVAASPIGVIRVAQTEDLAVVARADLRSAAVALACTERTDGRPCIVVGGDHPRPTFLLVDGALHAEGAMEAPAGGPNR